MARSSAMNSPNSTSTRWLGGDQVGITDRGAEQPFDPIDPVGGQLVGLDVHPPQAIAVGQHRDRRLQHGDGIAQGEGDGGVRERLQQRAELLEVLGGLQDPAVRAPQVAQHLELLPEEGVVRPLVEAR